MDHGQHWSRRRRAWQEISGIVADGAYAVLLAVPVAIGVAAYAFVYLSFLRHRLRRRAESRLEDRTRVVPDAGGDGGDR